MKYFYYDFSYRSWQDQIWASDIKVATIWDLIYVNNRYIINLWSKISWQELYAKELDIWDMNNDIKIVGKVFGKKTLELIHRMVKHYLTSYRAAISLFISNLSQYIRQLEKNKISKNKVDKINFINSRYQSIVHPDSKVWQTVILMPDLITIARLMKDRDYVLIWQDSHSKVMKYFVQIQKWQRNLLITTHWNIWIDRKNLTNIIVFYPETWYYKNQLDPRYDAIEVCHKLAQIHNANIKIIW